jgi:hypothetical protein
VLSGRDQSSGTLAFFARCTGLGGFGVLVLMGTYLWLCVCVCVCVCVCLDMCVHIRHVSDSAIVVVEVA